jgi:hypothetical protein
MRGSNGSAGMDCDRAAREQPYIQGLAQMEIFQTTPSENNPWIGYGCYYAHSIKGQ